MKIENIAMSNFALRHFKRESGGTKILDISPEEFVQVLNEKIYYHNNFINLHAEGVSEVSIIDGYADFCKLIILPNFTKAKTSVLPITLENYSYLRSKYIKRREGELPYLTRSFNLPLSPPIAKYLCVVIYSKEQLLKEHEADLLKKFEKHEKENNTILSDSQKEGLSGTLAFKFELTENDDYGVVAILAQNTCEEEPMSPETCLRNSMDIKYGGSGVPFDEAAYLKSVEFWEKNAIVSGWE